MTTLTSPLIGVDLPGRPLSERERWIIDDITRREFIIGGSALAALVATGCGSGDEGASDVPATRQVDTVWGAVEIPVSPTRIVATDFSTAQSLLLMGAPVVGFGGSAALLDIPVLEEYIAPDLVDGLQFVGMARDLNLELLASLAPDVIVGQADFLDEQRDELQAIAPVVVYPATFTEGREDWTQYHRTVGELLGSEAEAQRVLDLYDDTIAEVRRDLGERIDGRVRIAMLYTDYAAVYSETSHTGNVLTDLGLDVTLPAELDEVPAQHRHEISFERIEWLDEDHLIVLTAAAEADVELAPYRATSLWNTLTAVTNDRVLIADPGAWFGGGLGAFQILSDVSAWLND